MSTTATFPSGGNQLTLTATLQDQNGAAINLTGATVTLNVDRRDGSPLSISGSVPDATNGKCQFTLTSTHLSRQGRFMARVEAVIGSQTAPSRWFELIVE